MLDRKQRIRAKLRARVRGVFVLKGEARPRLSVFVSNKHIWVQVIDDLKGVTLASASDKDVDGGESGVEAACEIGKIIASRVLEKKVKKVVFDRGGRKYHGIVAALAQGARTGGLIF